MNTTRTRLLLASAATGALAAVVGLAIAGVGHDEPRLVRTAGVSAPLEQPPADTTPAVPAPAPEDTGKAAEVEATVKNHEARIGALESTTTTAPALRPAPTTTMPAAPVIEAEPTTTTTVTQAAPTTTTTFYGEPWWCSVPSGPSDMGHRKVPCDSTTTTSPS